MLKRRKENKFKEFILFLIMYSLMALVGAWRVFVMLRSFFSGFSASLYVGIYILVTIGLLVSFFFQRSRFTKFLDTLGSYWMCFQFVFFFSALLEWFGSLMLVYVLKWLSPMQYAYMSLVIFVLTLCTTIAGIINARIVRNTLYHCKVEKLSGTNKTYRIVHLTDLHLGSINDLKAMEKIIKKVNALNPDLICITGDTFTETVWDVYDIDDIAKAFKKLTSTYGTYACLGNHDFGKDLPQMLIFFEKAHIWLLNDEHVEFDNLILFGRSDRYPGGNRKHKREALEDFLPQVASDKLFIIMDHQPTPKIINESAAAGADLLLSGHTHGGQFFPMHLFIKKRFPQYYGCKKYGKMYCVVSSGTYATTPPIRIGSRSEIVEIILEG